MFHPFFYADTVTNYISWSMILQVVLLADRRGRLMNLECPYIHIYIPPARIRATTVDGSGSGSGLSVSIFLLSLYFFHAANLHTRMHRFAPNKHLQITKSELVKDWPEDRGQAAVAQLRQMGRVQMGRVLLISSLAAKQNKPLYLLQLTPRSLGL